MSAIKLVFTLVCLGVSASRSTGQKVGFSNVQLQGKVDHDVNGQDLMTLIQQQSAAIQKQEAVIQKQEAVIQKQSAAIETLEVKVEALQSQKTHRLVKRSADVNALQTLVQQQAAAIQTLQAKVTSLEAKESQTDTKVTTLDNQMARVQTQVNKQVAFSTSFTQDTHPINIGKNTPIKFDHVITNIGQAYDQHTGFFTAPSSGLYVFFLSIRGDNQHEWIYIGIVRSATTVLASVGVEGSSTNRFDKGSCFGTAHLNQGDKVHVQWLDGGGPPSLDQGHMTSFSGVLISADL